MYDDCPYVVRMRLKGRDLLGGVVVEDSQVEIIAAADNPILPGNKTPRSYGYVRELEFFDNGL